MRARIDSMHWFLNPKPLEGRSGRFLVRWAAGRMRMDGSMRERATRERASEDDRAIERAIVNRVVVVVVAIVA